MEVKKSLKDRGESYTGPLMPYFDQDVRGIGRRLSIGRGDEKGRKRQRAYWIFRVEEVRGTSLGTITTSR